MVNGITWEELTQAKLREAREKLKEVEAEANHLRQYVNALENALALDRRQNGSKTKGELIIDPERLRKQSVRSSLIDIAVANNGLLVVNDAVSILKVAEVFSDREHARNSIYSNLYHYKKQFKRERPGIYKFVGTQQGLLR